MKKFPNGFRSWAETHHEIVSIIDIVSSGNDCPEKITEIEENQGTSGFYDLCIELTDKFEEKHKGRKWDGDFWEEIEKFIENYLES